jgi:putative transposase
VTTLTRKADSHRFVPITRLPKAIRQAAIARVERDQQRGTVTDLVYISRDDWLTARWRFNGVKSLVDEPGLIGPRLKRLANLFGVSERSIRRWMGAYRKDPDIFALLPRRKGPPLGHRRLPPDSERMLSEVIDAWAARSERRPVSWIIEECRRRVRTSGIRAPGRACIEARLRDRGLQSLSRRRLVEEPAVAPPPTPRSRQALAIVQIDHTLVDVMVVDEVQRQSMGRPWITIAFDIATRAVLGFTLSLNAPSSVSVGLTLAMAALPKDRWLKERKLDLEWSMFGLPEVLHLDNGAEFHSLALKRGCERYGMSLEYRPPGRPHFGGHIERYLGTLMRRIHGLPGTTYSNPTQRGNYPSEARASMTLRELERWIALEIAGRYHLHVHRGVHAIPAQLWKREMRNRQVSLVADPARFLLDFLPAEMRRIGKDGFQLGRIRYWDPVLPRLFPIGTRILVRFDPRDLSRVFVPSPTQSEYLTIAYADLRRPPITLAERDRACTLLSQRGDTPPTEDKIFEANNEQRKIEEAAMHRSRRARRTIERRPTATRQPNAKPTTPVNYKKRVIPYAGEEW